MNSIFNPKTHLAILLAFIGFHAAAQSPDSIVIKQIDSIVLASRAFAGKKNYEKAISSIEAGEQLAISKLGKGHPAYGLCLFNHARAFQLKGDLKNAESFYLQAKSVQEKFETTDPQPLTTTLNNLGVVLKQQDRLEDCEQVYLKVRDLREKAFGKNHPKYAVVDNNLGSLYLLMSRFGEAEKVLAEAKEIYEKQPSLDTAQYTSVLDNLGNAFARLGQFDKAEANFLKTKALKKLFFGEFSPEYARLLNDMAVLYSDVARNEEAERYYLQAKKVQAEVPGKESPDYATTMSNLGFLQMDLGRFEEAERSLLEARAIWEKASGKDSPEYAYCIQILADLYYRLGQLDAAKPLFQGALDIGKKSGDTEIYSKTLNSLAFLAIDISDFKAAEPLFKEAKAIFEKSPDQYGASIGWALNNLGIMYTKMGRFAAADSMLTAAKALRERVLGKNHPDYADNLEDLAILYQKMGRPADALKMQIESRAIFEKTFGKEHPQYEQATRNLAILYQKQGSSALAAPLLAESNDIRKKFLTKSARYLSEREQAAYAASFVPEMDGLCSFARKNPSDASLPGLLFDNAVFYKGFLLTAANQVRHLARRDTVSQKKQELLVASNRRLAAELAKPEATRKNTDALENESNLLEKDLVRTVAGYGEATRQISWKDELAKLKPGEAAIEFVHYRYKNPEPTDSVLYAALLLKQGDAQPTFIQLFEEKSLDSLFMGQTTRSGDYANTLYSFPKRGASAVGKRKKSLYELIWKPLDGPLTGVKTVYFSPSGLLHRLNLGAIPYSMAETVSDRVQLIQLGSSRQIVAPTEYGFKNQETCLMGDIQYDIDTTALPSAEALASRGRGQNGENIKINRGNDAPEASPWQSLDWTAREVGSIQAMFEATGKVPKTLTGAAATEEAFKLLGEKAASPRTIHLATHGYFFPDPKSTGAAQAADGATQVFKVSDNAMIRSGLILAGGNFAWTTSHTAREGMEDGILTAFEISQMDLSSTELVVLSACETGLGDIKGNEGVYGLQRAFKIAGAKYLMMSLWQVPDQETSVFMTAFYKNMLVGKLPIREAFLAAQKDMKDRFINPYQWAGFVLVE